MKKAVTKSRRKIKKLSLAKLAAKNPRLKAKLVTSKNPNSPNYYTNRITFLQRESELGKNLTSKFLKVIHDKNGATRAEITKTLIDKGALEPVKIRGKINLAKTAMKLNFAFEGMQKKQLILKEEIRNKETGKVQTRNCRYSLTKFGEQEYKEKIKPNFRSWKPDPADAA